jgi:hypothetical protein
MEENIKPRFKFGIRGNAIIISISIFFLLCVMFGGKGTDTLEMNGYATTYNNNNPGSVKIFDIGVRSKAAIIRHEDGSLSALAFRKIPLLDRWKLTRESVPYETNEENKSVWLPVDDGFNRYFIISSGESLTIDDKMAWDGIYAKMLNDAVFVLLLTILLEGAKRLWKRRTIKKEITSIPT